MKIKILIGMCISLALLALSGCGGGGGGGGSTTATSTVSGLASKGPISGATITAFAIRSGAVAEELGQPVQTDANGNYSLNLGSYSGPVELVATNGSFTDEATQKSVTMTTATQLRAVISSVAPGTTVTAAVTPLTELAFRHAKGLGSIDATTIDASNKEIADNFGLTTIISKLPVAGDSDADKKNYAHALGVISQYIESKRDSANSETTDKALERLLGDLGQEVETNHQLLTGTITDLKQADTDFSGSGKDHSGGTDNITSSNSSATGGTLKISTAGTTATMGAIDMIVTFPAGVTVKADATTGEAASTAVVISGVAAVGSSKLVSAKFTPATTTAPAQLNIGLINSTGFGLGECVTIKFDLGTGITLPASASAFTISGFTANDTGGAPLSGITAAPTTISAGG